MAKTLIDGLILCGGQAQRMGGQDKGLILLHNKPLFQHGIERFAPQVGNLMINANRNLDIYRQSGCSVYPDLQTDYSGPLAGFQVGLEHCKAPFLAIIPCDSPLLPLDLVQRLHDAVVRENTDIAYVTTRNASGEKFSHPVFCLLRNGLLNHLNQFLQKGERKIDRWFHQLRYSEVFFEDESPFININTPEDLAHIEDQLK
jgi:molybdenum cofactor guanylyltransferase